MPRSFVVSLTLADFAQDFNLHLPQAAARHKFIRQEHLTLLVMGWKQDAALYHSVTRPTEAHGRGVACKVLWRVLHNANFFSAATGCVAQHQRFYASK